MKNVTTGVVLPLTDGVIDHIVDTMSDEQRADALRRTMRELRDLEAENAGLREALDAAVGYDPADAPPAPEQRAQIILNAERGLRGDRWIVETDGYPSILSDVWVVAWRPRRDTDGSDER
jgi:hypothetical protein